MSGVVISLNDDEEDDSAGLLADQDDSDMEDFLSSTRNSNGRKAKDRFRGNAGMRPLTTVRTTAGQLFVQMIVAFIFFNLGFTKSLLSQEDLQAGRQSENQLICVLGYLFGYLVSGYMLSRFSRLFVLFLVVSLMSVALLFIPWTFNESTNEVAHFIIGFCIFIILTSGNVMCLDMWGRKSGPHLQCLHFFLSLGLLTGPLLVDPLSHTKIPNSLEAQLAKLPSTLSNVSNFLPSLHQKSSQKSDANYPFVKDFKMSGSLAAGNSYNKLRWKRDLPSSTVDPLLAKLFGKKEMTLKKTVENLKEKKSNEIFAELDQLKRKIESSSRVKRSIRAQRIGDASGMRDGFGRVMPSYQQPHQQRFPGYPGAPRNNRLPDYPMYEQNLPQQYDYEDIGGFQGSGTGGASGIGLFGANGHGTPPPEVMKAADTIGKYIEGKWVGSNESSTTSTKTATTTTTTTTTTATTPKATTTTKISPEVKFTLSWMSNKSNETRDTNIKDSNNLNRAKDPKEEKTVEKVLENYGVAKAKIGFVLDSIFSILLSLLLLICLCYNPREPRSRQEEGVPAGPLGRRAESATFKYTICVLLFLFSLLHWGMYSSFDQVLPKINPGDPKSLGYVQQVLVGVFTATRFISIFASHFIPASVVVFASLLITFSGSLILVFYNSAANTVAMNISGMLWTGLILQASGLAPLLPASLAWCESYMIMSGYIVSFICAGAALGELGVPLLLGRLVENQNQTWMGFAALGSTTLACGLFTCAFLMAKKRGSRFDRGSRAAGYELADQSDDLGRFLGNDEEEDDDEVEEEVDDFEVEDTSARLTSSRQGSSMRLKAINEETEA